MLYCMIYLRRIFFERLFDPLHLPKESRRAFIIKLLKAINAQEMVEELRILGHIELRICNYNPQANILQSLAISDLLIFNSAANQ